MLMRNLDPGSGLCGGTRLLVLAMRQRVWSARNQVMLIPRIALDHHDNASLDVVAQIQLDFPPLTRFVCPQSMPFLLSRLQFLIELIFALTINKSQCQSLEPAGFDLSSLAFSHGQLYVALSRARSPFHCHETDYRIKERPT
jgi:ATP-dependent DNA helicase PIF1